MSRKNNYESITPEDLQSFKKVASLMNAGLDRNMHVFEQLLTTDSKDWTVETLENTLDENFEFSHVETEDFVQFLRDTKIIAEWYKTGTKLSSTILEVQIKRKLNETVAHLESKTAVKH